MDVADQGDVQQRFGLDPKILSGFAFTLGVGNQSRDELQDVRFAVDVRERVVVHRLFEVDGVQNFQPVAEMQKHFSAFVDNAAFRTALVKTLQNNTFIRHKCR